MSKSAKHLQTVLPVYRTAQIVLYIFYKICFGIKAFGRENIPNDGRGVIFASNHASYLDPPIFGITVKKHIVYLAKDYLYKPFLFGDIMRWLGTLPIKSETGTKDFRTVRDLLRVLKDGEQMVMFPEGTRTPDGKLQAPEPGIGFLAMSSKSWVVPAYIKGSYEAFPRDRKFIRCHPVTITYGKPFIPAEMAEFKGHPDPYLAVAQKIMAEIARLKQEQDKKV